MKIACRLGEVQDLKEFNLWKATAQHPNQSPETLLHETSTIFIQISEMKRRTFPMNIVIMIIIISMLSGQHLAIIPIIVLLFIYHCNYFDLMVSLNWLKNSKQCHEFQCHESSLVFTRYFIISIKYFMNFNYFMNIALATTITTVINNN